MVGDNTPHIAILLCTLNGEMYISEQLESIRGQTHQNWSLWIADDGSTDRTEEIIIDFCASHPEFAIHFSRGPEQGFCRNFMTLLRNKNIVADFFAFSDQDDIWLPEKLQIAIETLTETGASLYGGRTQLIDKDGRNIGLSPLFSKAPCVENAIVQSIMGGNTMVLSLAGVEYFRLSPDVDVVSHDWWLYLFLTASGFQVYYDSRPMTLYRQHGDNLIGANVGLLAKYDRLKRMMRSEFKTWNEKHLRALKACEPLLCEHGREMIERFEELQNAHGFDALNLLSDLRLTRQARAGEIALRAAAFLGKV